jgi:hypothetical protein
MLPYLIFDDHLWRREDEDGNGSVDPKEDVRKTVAVLMFTASRPGGDLHGLAGPLFSDAFYLIFFI